MPLMRPAGYPTGYNGRRLDGTDGNTEVDVMDRDVDCMESEGWVVAVEHGSPDAAENGPDRNVEPLNSFVDIDDDESETIE